MRTRAGPEVERAGRGIPNAERPSGSDRSSRRPLLLTSVAVGCWIALVVAARLVGLGVVHRDPRAALFFPPLAVRFDPRFPLIGILTIGAGVLVVAVAPVAAARLRWRDLLGAGFLGAVAWAVVLGAIDGVAGLTGDGNYLHDAPLIASPAGFLANFVGHIGRYTQHVRAHPPGMVLLLWAMRRIGLGGPGWEGALVTVAGAAMVPAAALALREVSGEPRARAALPFLMCSPIILWVATSADALYMGVSAWAVALVVLATGARDGRSHVLAGAGGLLFGAGLYLSYGLALLALVPAAVALVRRRLGPLAVAAAGALLVAVPFTAAGFWWPDGLHATLIQYRASAAQYRPQSAFWLINLGAFALALGPAAAVGLARLRDRRTWLLVGGGLLAVALADFSGFSKAEVERIWLPFAPWILLATGALALGIRKDTGRPIVSRAWVAVQVIACLALQFTIRGP